MNRNEQLLAAALDYVGGGMPVLPCGGKVPLTNHGVHDATLDPDQVRYWWSRWRPGANIGIPTGEPTRTVVVDIDVKNGVDGFASWAQLMTELDVDHHRTFSVVTPSGGFHYWYDHAAGGIGNTVGLVPGVDIRGTGGFVVAPPSTGPDGAYEVEYSDVDWMNPLPDPLPALLTEPSPAPHESGDPLEALARQLDQAPVGTSSAYLQAAFAGEVQRVMDSQPGGRNHALNKAAYNLGRIPDTDDRDIETALLSAASAVGLTAEDGEAQCLATVRSGRGAGRANPRHR